MRNCVEAAPPGSKLAALNIPPVFDNCTVILSDRDQIEARDLYWQVQRAGSPPSTAGVIGWVGGTEAVRVI